MLVGELETRVIELRHLDDVIGGGDLFPVVSKELSEVHGVVQSANYTERIRRRLFTVVGSSPSLPDGLPVMRGCTPRLNVSILMGSLLRGMRMTARSRPNFCLH